jgi:hypothetical protein
MAGPFVRRFTSPSAWQHGVQRWQLLGNEIGDTYFIRARWVQGCGLMVMFIMSLDRRAVTPTSTGGGEIGATTAVG